MTQTLAILIAFVSILFLLSMVVTGLVQATQGVLRIRSKNLLVAVSAVLDKHWGKEKEWSRKELLEKAAKVLNSDNIAVVDGVKNPQSALRRRFLGPRVSWADPKELAKAAKSEVDGPLRPVDLDAADKRPAAAAHGARRSHASKSDADGPGEADAEMAEGRPTAAAEREAARKAIDAGGRPRKELASLEHDFKELAPALSKRFQRFVRLWTILWSFAVAVAFQVSAPQLLKEFSSGARATEPMVTSLDETLVHYDPVALEQRYELVADAALDRVTLRYPQHADIIAEVGKEDTTRQGLIEEFLEVLSEVPESEEMGAVYGQYLDELANVRAAKAATALAEDAVTQLQAFGIEFWKDPTFYGEEWRKPNFKTIFGVLITAVLLSFGAPFWYEQLRNLAALRDLRAPPKPGKADKAATERGTGNAEADDKDVDNSDEIRKRGARRDRTRTRGDD